MSKIEFYNLCYDILYAVSSSDEEEIRTKAKDLGLDEGEIEQVVSFVSSRLPWVVLED
jgi:hypothetical protein